jgi:predicted permease
VSGLSGAVPGILRTMAHSLGICAVPLGLLMTGVNLANYLDEPSKLLHRNVALGACAVRLLIVPVLMLCLARFIPFSDELKRVMVIQAAMPAAVLPIIIARYYGGQPLTAVQVVLSTTAVGLLTCPLWIRAGLYFVGVS